MTTTANIQSDLAVFADLTGAAKSFIAMMQHRLAEVNGTDEREMLEGIIRNAEDVQSDLEGRRNALRAEVSPAEQRQFMREQAEHHAALAGR